MAQSTRAQSMATNRKAAINTRNIAARCAGRGCQLTLWRTADFPIVHVSVQNAIHAATKHEAAIPCTSQQLGSVATWLVCRPSAAPSNAVSMLVGKPSSALCARIQDSAMRADSSSTPPACASAQGN